MNIDQIEISSIDSKPILNMQQEFSKFLVRHKIAYETFAFRYFYAEHEDDEVEVRETSLYLLQNSLGFHRVVWGIGKQIFMSCLNDYNHVMHSILHTMIVAHNIDTSDIEDDHILSNGVEVEQIYNTTVLRFFSSDMKQVIETIQLEMQRDDKKYNKYEDYISAHCYLPCINLEFEQTSSNTLETFTASLHERIYGKYHGIPEAEDNPTNDSPALEEILEDLDGISDIEIYEGTEYIVSKKAINDRIITNITIPIERRIYHIIKYDKTYEVFAYPNLANTYYGLFVNLKTLAGFNTLNDWKKTPLYIGTIKGKTNQQVNTSFLEMMESKERKKDSDLINLSAMEYVWRAILKR